MSTKNKLICCKTTEERDNISELLKRLKETEGKLYPQIIKEALKQRYDSILFGQCEYCCKKKNM